MTPDPKTPRESRPPPRHADDSFTDLDRLDRPELDEDDDWEADWENETFIRRVPKNAPPTKPAKLSDCA